MNSTHRKNNTYSSSFYENNTQKEMKDTKMSKNNYKQFY